MLKIESISAAPRPPPIQWNTLGADIHIEYVERNGPITEIHDIFLTSHQALKLISDLATTIIALEKPAGSITLRPPKKA